MTLKTGNRKPQQPQVMMEINTTPLIDVMLVLLIMLIITIPVQLHSVDLNLPVAAEAPPPAQPPRVVRIGIAPDSSLQWDGEAVSLEELERRLQAAALQRRQPELHIRADRQAGYRQVVAVMAAVQRHQLTRVGIVGLEQFLQE